MTPRSSRFASARLRLQSDRKLPPVATLAVGANGLAVDFAQALADRLGPDEVFDLWGDETGRAAELLAARPPHRRRRLVRWWQLGQATPNPQVLGAARTLTGVRGTWLLGIDTGEPHQAWADGDVWRWRVTLRLSSAERLRWVQTLLGGAHRDVAEAMVGRVGTSPSALLSASRALALTLGPHPTTTEVDELLTGDAGRDFVSALLVGDRRAALATVGQVADVRRVLLQLQWRLGDLWMLSELRPGPTQRPARDCAEVTGLPVWVVEDLADLARFYPRSRVRDCTEAIAVAHAGHRAAPDLPRVTLRTLVAMWIGR